MKPEKRQEILNESRQILWMEHYKIFKFLNDSTVLEFVTKKKKNGVKQSIYQVGKITLTRI